MHVIHYVHIPFMQAYSYNFDLRLEPLNAYQLLPGATNALLTDRLIYVVSHTDVVNPCSVSYMHVCTCIWQENPKSVDLANYM